MPSHLFLVLLEMMEVVEIEAHESNQAREVDKDPEVGVIAGVVLKHNEAVPVALLVLLDYVCVLGRDAVLVVFLFLI